MKAQRIVLEVHICDQRRSYKTVFTGTDAEIDANAAAFWEARKTYCAMWDWSENQPTVSPERHPITFESASNIEDGFGHSTSASDELNELADTLESWAEEIDQADIPKMPDPNVADCDGCNGTGMVGESSCDECNGSGHPDEPTEDQMDEWRSEMEDAVSILDELPC